MLPLLLLTSVAQPQALVDLDAAWGRVGSCTKISQTSGSFAGVIQDLGSFGTEVTAIGDLNGDGVTDLAVGEYHYDPCGAIWILFMNVDGTVLDQRRITRGEGGFGGFLLDFDLFGRGLAGLGDLDGDCIPDLAVGAPGDVQGCVHFLCSTGAVWILFLNADGSVKREQKIVFIQDSPFAAFGYSVASPGDLDGDGVQDLIAGAPGDNDGGESRGAVWVLFLERDGTVKRLQKVSSTHGGLMEPLVNNQNFGVNCSSLGDLDGDGLAELGVGGIHLSGDGIGDVWMLFLHADGTVRRSLKIDALSGFDGQLDAGDAWARLAWGGDLDGDGLGDLLVGAPGDDDGGTNRGALWILTLNAEGHTTSKRKISDVAGGFDGVLEDQDSFGNAVARLGDLNGDGFGDFAVASWGDDDGGPDRGALWILFMGRGKQREAPSALDGGSVLVPLRTQPRCLYAQPRIVLTAGRPVAPGSLPVLALGLPGRRVHGLAGSAGTLTLVGEPTRDGRARFTIGSPGSLGVDALEARGFFVTPRNEVVPAAAVLVDPAAGIPVRDSSD